MRPSTIEVADDTTSLSVTRYLRWAGTAILVLAGVDFLRQGVIDLLPNYRHVVALLFSLVLSACGLLSGYRWRDALGARWFFALAMAFIPVHYSQLASGIYDKLFPTPTVTSMAPAWLWLAMNGIATMALSWPICQIGFGTLARHRKHYLSALLLAGSAVLLIPVRFGPAASGVLLACYMLIHYLDKGLSRDPLLATREGRSARIIVWLPWLTLVGRILYYPIAWVDLGILLAVLASFCLLDLRRCLQQDSLQCVVYYLGLLTAGSAWLCLAQPIIALDFVPFESYGYVFSLPLVAMGFALAPLQASQATRTRLLSGSLLAVTLMTSLVTFNGYGEAVMALLGGIALSATGLRIRQRWLLLNGTLCTLAGLVFYLSGLRMLYTASPWLTMTLAGIAILLMASFIDARGRSLWHRAQTAWQEVRGWH